MITIEVTAAFAEGDDAPQLPDGVPLEVRAVATCVNKHVHSALELISRTKLGYSVVDLVGVTERNLTMQVLMDAQMCGRFQR